MATRRKFLAYLGIGAASGPLAAKAAADAAVADLSSIARFGVAGDLTLGERASDCCPPTANSTDRWVPYEDRYKIAARLVRTTGIPDFAEREMRERAKHITSLDPDIASKRSWSMAVKIQEQRERNYQRRLAEINDLSFFLEKKSAFEKLFGFCWPW